MILLDTDICIYIIKKSDKNVLKKLKRSIDKKIFISSITVAELEYGVANSSYPERNHLALISFLSLFEILNFDDFDAHSYGIVKKYLKDKGKIIGPLDMLIASQALAKKFILVSNNVREYERIPDLKLENWTRN